MMQLTALPQSQEFFSGLLKVCDNDENRCGAAYGVRASTLQFFAFEIITFLFSLVIWYSARVLASYRRPGPYQPNCFEKWIPRLAGAIPLYALAATLLGPIRSFVSPLQVMLGLGFVTLLLLAPAVVHIRHPEKFSRKKMYLAVAISALGIISCTLHPTIENDYWWTIGSWITMFSCYVIFAWQLALGNFLRFFAIILLEAISGWAMIAIDMLARLAAGGDTWTWTIPVAMMVPAFYLFLVLFRRDLGWNRSAARRVVRLKRSRYLRRFLRALSPRMPLRVLPILLLALALGLAASIIVASDPESASKVLFAPSVAILWLLLALIVMLLFLFAFPLPLRFAIVATWLALVFFRSVPSIPLKQAEVPMPAGLCLKKTGLCTPAGAVGQRFDEWSSKKGVHDSGPIIVVAAAGGGGRAAAHTASLLAAVDAATCGKFGDRIFAISAVSGGSLGAAAYVAARHDLPISKKERAECMLNQERWQYANPRIEQLARMTSQDHLTPTLIRLLFRDLPLGAMPAWTRSAMFVNSDFYSRAGTLYGSWHNSYCQLLNHARLSLASTSPFNCASSNSFSFSPEITNTAQEPDLGPYMLFNGTSVQDGRRIVMSQPLFCPDDGYCAVDAGNSMLGNAIDSARFPAISPAHNRDVYGWNKWGKMHVMTQRSVVDGGYFDNSGVVTLLDVIDGLVEKNVDPKRIIAVVISSDPLEGQAVMHVENAADSGLLAMIHSPIQTVIRVRDGRTELALKMLEKKSSYGSVVYWPLTQVSLNPVDEDAKATRAATPEQTAREMLHGPADQLEKRFRHEPPLGWALSQESSEKILRYAQSAVLRFRNVESTIFTNERDLMQRLYAEPVVP